MDNNAEDKVSKFYNSEGWQTKDGITEDARLWEDLREHAEEYVSRCRRRLLPYIPESGENMLDMASGPIQYKEYLEYSKNFKKRYCLDLSLDALNAAKKKIGDQGEFLHGSFFDLYLEEDFFDCSICLHAIYHIDKDKQEEAVRKLIHVTKPGKPVIILYSNPNTIISKVRAFIRIVRGKKIPLDKNGDRVQKENYKVGYFYLHSVEWWNRFNDVANVKVLPWRSFAAHTQKKFIPDNKIGSMMFRLLFNLEKWFPTFFVKNFLYSMIVITKKTRAT